MKPALILTVLSLAAASVFSGCDARVETPPTVVEKKDTTIVNPAPEKKVENNTTIVNPAPEKKVENNTTIVNPPAEKK